MRNHAFEPLPNYVEYSAEQMRSRSTSFLADMQRRRTVRDFSDRSVPREIIEHCISTAMTAPSGANMQPWHFVVIQDLETKRQMRAAAEQVERDFYAGRASDEWLEALVPLGTDEHKPFLEIAPYLIVIFAQLHGMDPSGAPVKHYYVNESVGIATGMLIAAVHLAGLACLTHTPAPMRFLNEICQRPSFERPYLILAVGYPSLAAQVPKIDKKKLSEACQFL